MAFLRSLKDLITLSRSVPQYTANDPTNVPIVGPDGEDYSIDQPNNEPLKQIGTRRVSSPLQARIKSGLPDIISSGIAAAAHQNTSGGGATDFFGALQDADTAREKKQQIELTRQRQAQIDADNLAYKRAQTAAIPVKLGQTDTANEIKGRVADTGATKAADTATYQQGQLGNEATKTSVDARSKGYDLIPPMFRGGAATVQPATPQGQSLQQNANLAKTGAETENLQARTDVVAPKPTKGDALAEEIAAKKKIADDQHLQGAERQHFIYGTPMPSPGAANAGTARSDKSYQFNVGELNKIGKPVEDITGRIGRLQDTLAQNSPQADALIGPELLTVMAGGQGSGLRMNEAEIARVIGGRSNWESLKASINKWALDPKEARSITPAQQQQIRTLVGAVASKLQAKQKLLNDAHEALLNSEDPAEHRKIVARARQAFSEVDQPHAGAGGPIEEWTRDASGKLVKK